VPILHIVRAAREQLEVQGIEPGPVGLMGTQATLDMELYQQGIGRECIVADADMMKRLVSPGIALVKANRVQDAYAPLAEAAGQLRAKGARAVVLGCTEIPLGISAGPRLDFPVIDTVAALALASLRFIRSGDARVKVPTEPIAGSVG
jgi:aspartate racemase